MKSRPPPLLRGVFRPCLRQPMLRLHQRHVASKSNLPNLPHSVTQQLAEARASLRRLEEQLEQLRARLPHKLNRSVKTALAVVGGSVVVYGAYQLSSPFRRTVIAVERCGRIGIAVLRCMLDYKLLFWKTDDLDGTVSQGTRHDAYENCHRRCAERIRVRKLSSPPPSLDVAHHRRRTCSS